MRSAAVKSARVVSSAMTITSLGPAIESMSTSPKTCFLASATNRDCQDPRFCRRVPGPQPHKPTPPLPARRQRDKPPSRRVHDKSPANLGCTTQMPSAAPRRQSAPRPRLARARRSSTPSTDTPRRRRNANADPPQRQIALREIAAMRGRHGHRLMKNRLLELQDPLPNPPHRLQERRIGRRMGRRQFRRRHAQLGRRASCLPSSFAVYSSTAGSPRSRTSPQIRSTTCTPASAVRRRLRSSSAAPPR
jgi:hypothetical protein